MPADDALEWFLETLCIEIDAAANAVDAHAPVDQDGGHANMIRGLLASTLRELAPSQR